MYGFPPARAFKPTRWLNDGDTVTLRAYCTAPGAVRIGLGSVSGTVQPA